MIEYLIDNWHGYLVIAPHVALMWALFRDGFSDEHYIIVAPRESGIEFLSKGLVVAALWPLFVTIYMIYFVKNVVWPFLFTS